MAAVLFAILTLIQVSLPIPPCMFLQNSNSCLFCFSGVEVEYMFPSTKFSPADLQTICFSRLDHSVDSWWCSLLNGTVAFLSERIPMLLKTQPSISGSVIRPPMCRARLRTKILPTGTASAFSANSETPPSRGITVKSPSCQFLNMTMPHCLRT